MAKKSLAEKDDVAARDAKHGEKMIEIKVRFWTDSLTKSPTQVVPKHALSSGVLRIERNATHGITPNRPLPFNSIFELGAIIEKCLVEHNIVLHASRKMKKYFRA